MPSKETSKTVVVLFSSMASYRDNTFSENTKGAFEEALEKMKEYISLKGNFMGKQKLERNTKATMVND